MLVVTQSGKFHAAVVRTGVFAGAVTIALGLLGSSAAMAQNCGNLNLTGPIPFVGTLGPIGSGLSGGLAISAAVSAANTAFLTQSTAFVSSPGNAKPNSEGAGMWIRGVGGDLTLNSNTSINAAVSVPNIPGSGVAPGTSTGSTTCNTKFHESFGGFQLGYDIAKLNVGGWNLTLGTTAGFLETSGNIVNGNVFGGAFNSTTQAPFVGTYAAAILGSFFIEGKIQADYFQTTLDSPTATIFNQKVDAHGFTAALSAGYNWEIPNSTWFIEPSAGVIWSRESPDQLNMVNPVTNNGPFFQAGTFPGATQVNTIESVIGRVGVRVGTSVELDNIALSPFAAVSVWHDFGSNLTANYSSCPFCFFVTNPAVRIPVPSVLSAQLSTNNIGTYGQYSLGVSGQIKNTGWLGFARVDYREGPEMHGLSATGGIRYQFTPIETASAFPTKAKALVDHAVNWTGWYAGLIGGTTEYGRSSMEFPGISTAQMRPSGWLGGGTLGYNYQAGKWVYGLEGDIAGTNTNGSSPCAPLQDGNFPILASVPTPLFETTCHDKLNWIATAAARLGYAWTPRSLLYVKAGGAFAGETASVTCNLGPLNGHQAFQNCYNPSVPPVLANPFTDLINSPSVGTTRVGWTVGFGTEFALTDRWSIKGEFDWLDFGTKSLTLSDGTFLNSTLRIAEGKIGVNYKFWP
jgi:opacity protein-like surface antigen